MSLAALAILRHNTQTSTVVPDNPTNPILEYAVLNAQTNMVLRYYKQVSVSEAFVIATPNTFYREHIV